MPQQEVPDVLDAMAIRIRTVSGIKNVDAFRPRTLAQLPCVVLHYLDSPWTLSPGRNETLHTIQIDIIVAKFADERRGRREAVGLMRDVKAELFAELELIPQPNQTTLGPEGSQAVRNVIYNETPYLAGIIIVRAVEVTGETFDRRG